MANWYYSISPSNYGEWTVTATLSGDTKSDIVTFDSNKQYDVYLGFDKEYLIRNGILQSGYTLYTYGSTVFEQRTGFVYFSHAEANNGRGYINLKDAMQNKPYLVWEVSDCNMGGTWFDGFGIASSTTQDQNGWSPKLLFYNSTGAQQRVLDTTGSSLIGKYFAIGGNNTWAYITNLYFAEVSPT